MRREVVNCDRCQIPIPDLTKEIVLTVTEDRQGWVGLTQTFRLTVEVDGWKDRADPPMKKDLCRRCIMELVAKAPFEGRTE